MTLEPLRWLHCSLSDICLLEYIIGNHGTQWNLNGDSAAVCLGPFGGPGRGAVSSESTDAFSAVLSTEGRVVGLKQGLYADLSTEGRVVGLCLA